MHFSRLFFLLRYHRPGQLVRRFCGVGRNRLRPRRSWRPVERSCSLRQDRNDALRAMARRRRLLWPHKYSPEYLRDIAQGRFCFLNLALDLSCERSAAYAAPKAPPSQSNSNVAGLARVRVGQSTPCRTELPKSGDIGYGGAESKAPTSRSTPKVPAAGGLPKSGDIGYGGAESKAPTSRSDSNVAGLAGGLPKSGDIGYGDAGSKAPPSRSDSNVAGLAGGLPKSGDIGYGGAESKAPTSWSTPKAPAAGGLPKSGDIGYGDAESKAPTSRSTPKKFRIRWRPEAPRLWLFHLQSQEFLLELAGCVSPSAAWDVVADWLAEPRHATPYGDPDAWHPFCISRRLPVWLMLAAEHEPPESLAASFWSSVGAQVQWLGTHLERDLGGNHLLENLRALVLAATFLDLDPPIGRRQLLRHISAQIDEQILATGEHYERTPTYHALMQLAVLEICESLVAGASDEVGHHAVLGGAADALRRMSALLRGILHPDGQIPLLGDSVFAETPLPGVLCDAVDEFLCRCPGAGIRGPVDGGREPGSGSRVPRGRWLAPKPLRQGDRDYWTWRGGAGHFLLFDTGPLACDHLPAHGHADLLGIEASVHGQRLFVDTGTFDYEDSATRQAARGTAAHNTLRIGDRDHADMWSRFRMGRRGHPLDRRVEIVGDYQICIAAHDAYRWLGIPRVERTVIVRSDGDAPAAQPAWWIIDRVVGKWHGEATSRLHLHPDITVERSGTRTALVAWRGADGVERQLSIELHGAAELRVEPSQYFPEFGVAVPNQVLVGAMDAAGPPVLVWSVCGGEPGALGTEIDRDEVRVRYGSDQWVAV